MATSERPRRAMKPETRRGAIRRQILGEWRGCDEVTSLEQGVCRAASLVSSILKASGTSQGLQEEEVRGAWKSLAGEFIARHAEPVSVKNGMLVLRVTQPAMRFHLEQMKPMLFKRIQERLGADKVRSIRFTLG